MQEKRIFILLALLGIIFICNPAIGTILILFVAFITNEKKFALPTLIVVLLFIWSFQSTRSFNVTESSDWAGNYYINFSSIPNTSLFNYIFAEKEFCWQIFNIVGYYLFNGNFLVYANFIVFLTYAFTLFSIYKYWCFNRQELRFLITSIVLFVFMSEVQSLSNNLLRQQFAFSIILYVIVEKLTQNKISKPYYMLAAISVFTHTMTFLFVPFLFINLGKRYSIKGYFRFLMIFLMLYVSLRFIPFLSGIGFYGFQRLATSAEYTGTDVMNINAVYPFIAIMALFYVKAFFIDKDCERVRMYFLNLMAILLLLCLLMETMPLMLTRYFIIRMFLIPFIVPYLFTKNTIAKNIYLAMVCLTFIVRFYRYDYYWFNIDTFLNKNIFQFNLLNILY